MHHHFSNPEKWVFNSHLNPTISISSWNNWENQKICHSWKQKQTHAQRRNKCIQNTYIHTQHLSHYPFSVQILLAWKQEGHLTCKKGLPQPSPKVSPLQDFGDLVWTKRLLKQKPKVCQSVLLTYTQSRPHTHRMEHGYNTTTQLSVNGYVDRYVYIFHESSKTWSSLVHQSLQT